MRPARSHLLFDVVLGLFFVGALTLVVRDVLNLAEKVAASGTSHLYVWVSVFAVIVGTVVWWLEGSPSERIEVRGSMGVGDFFRTITLRTPEGKVFLWGSAANMGLAIALFAAGERLPSAEWLAWAALLWPFMMFIMHIRSFSMGWFEDRWFRIVILVAWATLPSVKILHDLSKLGSA